MTNSVGLFKTVGQRLDTTCDRWFSPKSITAPKAGKWVGRNVLMVGEKDEFLQMGIDILKGEKAAPPMGFLRWWKALHLIPKPLRKPLGLFAEHIQTTVPIIKDLPTYFKFNAVFAALGIGLGAIKGLFSGFRQTEGNLGDKALGAVSQGAQQAGRNAGILAISSAAALFIPKLLFGLSGGGAAMVIVGGIASHFAEKFADTWFNKALPKTASKEVQAVQVEQAAGPVSRSGADMVRFMEQLDSSSRHSAAKAPNPFIEAIPGGKEAMNDANWKKLVNGVV